MAHTWISKRKLKFRSLLHSKAANSDDEPSSSEMSARHRAKTGVRSSSKKYAAHPRLLANAKWYKKDLLHRTNRKIRLLQLDPGKGDDVISAKLVYVPVKDKPRYDALSYSWGDHQAWREITMDGSSGFAVTQTLWSALRRLRSTTAVRVLWIDAICINQGNREERNSEVLHMGTTFSNARSVIAWLGECGPMADDIKSGSNADHIEEILTQLRDVTPDQTRAWWNRVWVVQEVALAAEILVYLGPYVFTWAEFFSSTEQRPEWAAIGNLRNIRAVIHSRGREEDISLTDVLSLTNTCYASDPLDYVFGIVGLIGHKGTDKNVLAERKQIGLTGRERERLVNYGLLPDYSLTWQALLERLGTYVLSERRYVEAEFNASPLRGSSFIPVSDSEMDPWSSNKGLELTPYEELLVWTAKSGHVQIACLLLESGLLKSERMITKILFIAVKEGHVAIAQLLKELCHIDFNTKDSAGCSPIIVAAIYGRASVVEFFVGDPSVDPNKADNRGRSALSWAVYEGQRETVRVLLDSGRVQHIAARVGGDTILGWAVRKKHNDVVQLLLDRNAVDPRTTDDSGHTPLWWAEVTDSRNTVRLLEEATNTKSQPTTGPVTTERIRLGIKFWRRV